jgi:hypothetical protein
MDINSLVIMYNITVTDDIYGTRVTFRYENSVILKLLIKYTDEKFNLLIASSYINKYCIFTRGVMHFKSAINQVGSSNSQEF